MTLTDIIDRLEEYRDEFGGDCEVRLMTQQAWPFENAIIRLVSGSEINALGDQEGRVQTDAVIYIVEGKQLRYGSKRAWDA